jgi:hypothetical protein
MSNVFQNIDYLTNEIIGEFANNNVMMKLVNRDFDEYFGKSGMKSGDTINIRKPNRFNVNTGANLNISDITDTYVPLTLQQKHVDIAYSTKDESLSIDQVRERYIKPAVNDLVNDIEATLIMPLYKGIYNSVGTAGTTPNAALTYLQAGVALDNNSTPVDGRRSAVIDPLMQATIVDSLKGLFQSSEKIASQYESGNMATALGYKWSMSQNIPSHTVGALGGTPLTNGAGQTGANLVTDGWTASAATRLLEGDVFTIAGVYAVNPLTKQTLKNLQQFVVTADAASDGSGNMTIAISPAIVATGATKNVSAAPADGAAITVSGAANTVSPQGLVFHRDAIAFAMADLAKPAGVESSFKKLSDLGLSIRTTKFYDGATDRNILRIDTLCGAALTRPEYGCRVYA